jgi:hypothetical protein
MDNVVEYLSHQENVEVLKRIKLGGTQPFSGRSVSEVVVAKIDEVKAQRLRSVAPAHLLIERDSLLACADYLSVPARGAPIGTLLPLRSVATDVSIRVIGERDQPLARATVVIEGGGLPAQALTDETGTARITFFGGTVEAIQTLFIRSPPIIGIASYPRRASAPLPTRSSCALSQSPTQTFRVRDWSAGVSA